MLFRLTGEAAITRQRTVDSKLLEFADTNRSKGLFNDVEIKVGSESFPANRLILACYSHYFESMFTVEMKERYKDVVQINGVDIKSWKLLFNFIYSGSIAIDCANVVGLLAAADYLQVDDAKAFCFEFIESVISMDNCFDVLNVANMYSNAFLQKKVIRFISLNFAKVSQLPSLKTVSEDDFTLCVSNLNLNVVDNCLLYETVIDWIKVDEESRKHNLPKLLSCINFSKIPEAFFEQKITTERLVIENLDCASLMLKTAVKLLSKKASVTPSSKIFSIHTEDSSVKISLIYNHVNDVPHNYPEVPVQNIFGFCALNCGDFVYFIGGRSHETMMQEQLAVWRLNITEENLKWEDMAPMLVQRHYMDASVLRNMIVVAGGINNKDYVVNSAQVYDSSQNLWQAVSSLNQERCRHVLVTCKDCVYALGGYSDNHFSLSSVEKLSDIDGKWQVVQPMSIPRAVFAAVAWEGKIYAIGGFIDRCGSGVLKSVERYCPQSDEWVTVSSMNDERYGHLACVLQGKIYVAGGLGIDNCKVDSIECYDPSIDQWNIVGKLDKKFHRHSTCLFVV